MEIWKSKDAEKLRKAIRDKKCFCSNEIFLWPSITFQPFHLISSMLQAKVWQKLPPLETNERYVNHSLLDTHNKSDEHCQNQ
jgi:hypothetical protein